MQISHGIDYEESPTKWARWFSLENMVIMIKKIFAFFFRITGVHMLLGVVVLYKYYRSDISFAMDQISRLMIKSKFTANQFVELFKLITILYLLGYTGLDIRHKANVYSDIRAERFRELIRMEEKLYSILDEIVYSLRKNIDVIAERKNFILQSGATSLSGKRCYIYDAKIEFKNEDPYYFSNLNFPRKKWA